jgi:hypothetical protein
VGNGNAFPCPFQSWWSQKAFVYGADVVQHSVQPPNVIVPFVLTYFPWLADTVFLVEMVFFVAYTRKCDQGSTIAIAATRSARHVNASPKF